VFIEAIGIIVLGFYGHRINKKVAEQQRVAEQEKLLLASKLENRNYISKVRFDTEYGMHRELSKAFFDLDKCICTMIPPITKRYEDDNKQREHDHSVYNDAAQAVVRAQDALHYNAPFIQQQFFGAFSDILKTANLQMWLFAETLNETSNGTLKTEDYARTLELHEMLLELTKSIRDYWSAIDVLSQPEAWKEC
jgi:hypothetical protein